MIRATILITLLVLLCACNETTSPSKTQWTLTLVFSCDPTDGCGEPPTVALDTYKTESECKSAGAAWLDPKANPTNAVKSINCA